MCYSTCHENVLVCDAGLSPVICYLICCCVCVTKVLPGHSSTPRIVVGGVMFQADIDNSSNFPTERSFHTFKKQRFTASFSALYDLLNGNIDSTALMCEQCQ